MTKSMTNYSRNPVQSMNALQETLQRLNTVDNMPFRRIALLDDYIGIPAGTLANIAKGREPKDPVVRLKLRLDKRHKPKPPEWVKNAADTLVMLRQRKVDNESEAQG